MATGHRLPEVQQPRGPTLSAEADDPPRTRRQPAVRAGGAARQDTAQPVCGDPARQVGLGAQPEQVQCNDRGGLDELGDQVGRRAFLDDSPDRAQPLAACPDRDDEAGEGPVRVGRHEDRLVGAGQPPEHSLRAQTGQHLVGHPAADDGGHAGGVGHVLAGGVREHAGLRVLDGDRGVDEGGGGVGEREEVVLHRGVPTTVARAGRGPVDDPPEQPDDVCPGGLLGESHQRQTVAAGTVAHLSTGGEAAPEHQPSGTGDRCRPDQGHGVLGGLDPHPEHEVAGLAHHTVAGFGDGEVVDLAIGRVDDEGEQTRQGGGEVGDAEHATTVPRPNAQSTR